MTMQNSLHPGSACGTMCVQIRRNVMSQVKRMLEGKLYCCLVPDEKREQMQKKKEEFLDKFNATSFGDFETRRSLAKQLFAHLGENSFINKPFFLRLRLQHQYRRQLLRKLRLHNAGRKQNYHRRQCFHGSTCVRVHCRTPHR